MDGILGVGIAELVVIVLVVLLIGGPRNAMRWAYQAGQIVRELKTYWDRMMGEVKKEFESETKMLREAREDLQKDLREVETATNPKTLMAEATQPIEEALRETEEVLGEDLPIRKQRGTLKPIKNREAASKKPWLAYRDD